MNQIKLQQGISPQLSSFPHVQEFLVQKVNTIQLNSFPEHFPGGFCLFYILEGKFEWLIDGREHILFPGDLIVILPDQKLSGKDGLLNIGAYSALKLAPDQQGKELIGKWSGLSSKERLSVRQILTVNKGRLVVKLKHAQSLFQLLHQELLNEQVGSFTRVGHIIDELIITISRELIRQNSSQRDFPQVFMRLEQNLRQNLAHQWTVDEMAALTGMGTTAFTEKVKSFSGFSPLNYLINLRITEATKLLKRGEVNITDIALTTGFYSSQHFSTTFKKLTGYTPSEFRKNNVHSTNRT